MCMVVGVITKVIITNMMRHMYMHKHSAIQIHICICKKKKGKEKGRGKAGEWVNKLPTLKSWT